jgi:hypothetical protein
MFMPHTTDTVRTLQGHNMTTTGDYLDVKIPRPVFEGQKYTSFETIESLLQLYAVGQDYNYVFTGIGSFRRYTTFSMHKCSPGDYKFSFEVRDTSVGHYYKGFIASVDIHLFRQENDYHLYCPGFNQSAFRFDTGQNDPVVSDWPLHYVFPIWEEASEVTDQERHKVDMTFKAIAAFGDDSVHPEMSAFTGGLFLTDTEAISTALGDVSRNFETLVEASQVMEPYAQALAVLIQLHPAFKAVKPKEFLIFLLYHASSLQVAYLFGIAPTLSSVLDILKKEPESSYAEDGEIFSSAKDGYTLQQVYGPSIQAALGSLNSSRVIDYYMRIRSEVEIVLEPKNRSSIFFAILDEMDRRGLAVDSSGIYAISKWSWFHSMYLDIQGLIGRGEAYVKALIAPKIFLGRSVYTRVLFDNGLTVTVYRRAALSQNLLPFPDENWNKASGFYWEAIVPLFITFLLRGSGRKSYDRLTRQQVRQVTRRLELKVADADFFKNLGINS